MSTDRPADYWRNQKARKREEKAAQGLVRCEVWVYPECREHVRRYAQRLTETVERLKKAE